MARKKKQFPEVVQVKHDRKKFKKHERQEIFERDNFTCQLCKKDLSELPTERVLDHRIPLSQFGTNALSNIWLLCMKCDREKKSTVIPMAIKMRIEELEEKHRRNRRNINKRKQ